MSHDQEQPRADVVCIHILIVLPVDSFQGMCLLEFLGGSASKLLQSFRGMLIRIVYTLEKHHQKKKTSRNDERAKNEGCEAGRTDARRYC